MATRGTGGSTTPPPTNGGPAGRQPIVSRASKRGRVGARPPRGPRPIAPERAGPERASRGGVSLAHAGAQRRRGTARGPAAGRPARSHAQARSRAALDAPPENSADTPGAKRRPHAVNEKAAHPPPRVHPELTAISRASAAWVGGGQSAPGVEAHRAGACGSRAGVPRWGVAAPARAQRAAGDSEGPRRGTPCSVARAGAFPGGARCAARELGRHPRGKEKASRSERKGRPPAAARAPGADSDQQGFRSMGGWGPVRSGG